MTKSPRDRDRPPVGSTVRDLEDVLTEGPVVLYTMTLQGDRLAPTWVSNNVTAILGYSVESALAPGWWWTHVHPDDRPAAAASDAALREHGHYSHEYRFCHANGDYIWVLDQMKVITRQGPAPTVVGSWTDITEARRYRQQLEEAEAHYRRLIRTSPYAVYTLDATGCFRELNPAAERLLGRTDLLNESFTLVMAPQDLAAGMELFERVMAGGTETIAAELHVRRPDGTDRLLAISVSPIVQEGAEGVQGVHGIARDITEERRIERDRERVRQHYERLVKTSPDAIYALDTAGRFTEVSDATTRLLRRPVQELIGTSFAALIAPEDLPMAMASFNRKLADEVETTEINIHMIRGDGERRLVNIRATQIRDGDRVIGSHGIGRDVTDESAREEQLRRAERLASVVHVWPA
jgi:PAS domain S-box-containing protein